MSHGDSARVETKLGQNWNNGHTPSPEQCDNSELKCLAERKRMSSDDEQISRYWHIVHSQDPWEDTVQPCAETDDGVASPFIPDLR